MINNVVVMQLGVIQLRYKVLSLIDGKMKFREHYVSPADQELSTNHRCDSSSTFLMLQVRF